MEVSSWVDLLSDGAERAVTPTNESTVANRKRRLVKVSESTPVSRTDVSSMAGCKGVQPCIDGNSMVGQM